MLPGVPSQARWTGSGSRRDLPARVLRRIVQNAFPGCRLAAIEPLAGGLRNSNFKLLLDAVAAPFVLRIYEHDASLCQKEIDLMRLVRDAVPIPEVVHAEPSGWEQLPPFLLMRFVEGITYRELHRTRNTEAIAQAANSVGETLAAIGRHRFASPGWLTPGPAVGPPLLDGADPIPRFVDLCLASTTLQRRMPDALRRETRNVVWSQAARLASLGEETSLVHGDFNRRNLLVHSRAGRWCVAAVLDWEFAVAGSPLADIANILRYERASRPKAEPHFSAGYSSAGGLLPHDWRRMARLVDLAALCEILTHDPLPDDVVAEVVELIRATFEDRDPEI